MTNTHPESHNRWAVLLSTVYVLAIATPLLLVTTMGSEVNRSFAYELGKGAALAGFVILTLQVILVARFSRIETPSGLDVLWRFHKYMGLFGAGLILCHPVLLSIGRGDLVLLLSTDLPFSIILGKIGLIALLIHTTLSIMSPSIRLTPPWLDFERWRIAHVIIAPAIIVLTFSHSWLTGADLRLWTMRAYWLLLFIGFAGVYTYIKIFKPGRLRGNRYEVTDVAQETSQV